MFKKLNIKGVSHHLLLPILAVLVVAGIGGYIMQRSSSAATKVFVTAGGKSCVQRTFAKGSSSTCVSYAQRMMGMTGKDVDGAFGSNTRQKLSNATGGGTVLNTGTWNTLCKKVKTSNKTLWTQAGCGGQGTNTYLSKPTASATNPDYRWGYFNCYPQTKIYPAKPVWGCQRKWVKKSDTVNTSPKGQAKVWAIKSAQPNVIKRAIQFRKDYGAWYTTKAYYDGNISAASLKDDCSAHANGSLIAKSSRKIKVGNVNKATNTTGTQVCKAGKAY